MLKPSSALHGLKPSRLGHSSWTYLQHAYRSAILRCTMAVPADLPTRTFICLSTSYGDLGHLPWCNDWLAYEYQLWISTTPLECHWQIFVPNIQFLYLSFVLVASLTDQLLGCVQVSGSFEKFPARVNNKYFSMKPSTLAVSALASPSTFVELAVSPQYELRICQTESASFNCLLAWKITDSKTRTAVLNAPSVLQNRSPTGNRFSFSHSMASEKRLYPTNTSLLTFCPS